MFLLFEPSNSTRGLSHGGSTKLRQWPIKQKESSNNLTVVRGMWSECAIPKGTENVTERGGK